jgi:hypothetical protein
VADVREEHHICAIVLEIRRSLMPKLISSIGAGGEILLRAAAAELVTDELRPLKKNLKNEGICPNGWSIHGLNWEGLWLRRREHDRLLGGNNHNRLKSGRGLLS